MDSFSGIFPLEFISFYLDIAPEAHNEANPVVTAEAQVKESDPQTHVETDASHGNQNQEDAAQAESEKSGEAMNNGARVELTPSPSTNESISAYNEGTLQTLGCQGTGLDITILPPNDPVTDNDQLEPEIEKASESEPIVQVTTEPAGKLVTKEGSTGRLTSIARWVSPLQKWTTFRQIPATWKICLTVTEQKQPGSHPF